MVTVLLTHADCLKHVNPVGHPERVARLQAIVKSLEASEFDNLIRVDAPSASDDDLNRVHPSSHLERILAAIPQTGFAALDQDTFLSPGSLSAARHAFGANIKAVDLVLSGQARNAFCAIRPPGHHAEARQPMGFCLFGNVVAGARHSLRRWGLERVAIIDFDVHHGNGTQDLVWDDANIAFVSIHQMPLYPGSGSAAETGASGNILNLPLMPNSGSAEFRLNIELKALPFLRQFDPQMLFISAGFDAHRADPLANLNLSDGDFYWVTKRICGLADDLCNGRVVSTLEGGYDLDALAASVSAHVRALMENGA